MEREVQQAQVDVQKSAILKLEGISKSFPGVKALQNIHFDVHKGEVHALLGENGAGKSTLMKILAGLYSSDEGQIIYNNEKMDFRHPLEAKAQGIVLIYQELSLVEELTVAENLFLGSYPTTRFGLVDGKKMRKEARIILDELDCTFSENQLVGELNIARQQMVEIAGALALNGKVVIFDEPTASLTQQDKEVLFRNIKRLKENGVAIVYISHKMDEIFEISDRITVLRDGQKTATIQTSETNENEVTQLMIGRSISGSISHIQKTIGSEILRVAELTNNDQFENINFTLHKGEILGMYGLVGAGRSEVAETIFGIRKADKGKIFIDEKEEEIRSSLKAVKLGIGFVPESRKEQGLILGLSGQINMTLAKLNKLQRFGFTINSLEENIFKEYQEKLSISITGPHQVVGNLSGGNQQKIVIGKWLCNKPKILILDEPTRGIDVGSKSEIHKLIRQLAAEGYAILVISSEMPEIINVSDRVITMKDGKMTGDFTGEQINEKNLINAIMINGGNS